MTQSLVTAVFPHATWDAKRKTHRINCNCGERCCVDVGDNGALLFKCWHCGGSGKEYAAKICELNGTTFADTWNGAPSQPIEKPTLAFNSWEEALRPGYTAPYVYHDANNKPVLVNARYDTGTKKTFSQTSLRSNGWVRHGWSVEKTGYQAPLYGLPGLIANPDSFVWFVEGEKCADFCWAMGLVATTVAGSLGGLPKHDFNQLAGKTVYVIPDNDQTGLKFAEAAAQQMSLVRPKISVYRVDLPRLTQGQDIADWDGSKEELLELAQMAPEMNLQPPKSPKEQQYDAWLEMETNLGDIKEDPEPEWLWEGYIAKGSSTLIHGDPKAGKTTVLLHLLRECETGGTLFGKQVNPANVYYLSEESAGFWAARRDNLNLGRHITMLRRPGVNNIAKWADLLAFIKDRITALEVDALIIDTWASITAVKDENDAAQVNEALKLLHDIMEMNVSTTVVHHASKAGGDAGHAVRGSSAFAGYFDNIVEIRLVQPKNPNDRRRTITTIGRFEDSPGEVAAQLSEDKREYVAYASAAEMRSEADLEIALEIIHAADNTLTSIEILKEWPAEGEHGERIKKPDRRRLQETLGVAASYNTVKLYGEGIKGNPFKYGRYERLAEPKMAQESPFLDFPEHVDGIPI